MTHNISTVIPDSRDVNVISWNVKGVNYNVKRKKVLSHLQHLEVGIAMLQETHLRNKDHVRIHRDWVGQVFHSKFDSKSRGAAILIHKNIHFNATNTISDPNGRYVMVVGKLFKLPVILVSIYAPNFDDHCFFERMFSSIPNLDSHHLILSGNYNLVMDPVLDRSSHATSKLTKSAQTLQAFTDTHKLINPWRFKNPSKREYSFFSSVHKSFSRTDFFRVDPFLLNAISDCKYNSIMISDHAPIGMTIKLQSQRSRWPWRLGPFLLADSDFAEFISEQTDFYLETNQTDDISASTLWKALKVYLGGQIIAHNAHTRKIHHNDIMDMSSRIKTLDDLISTSPTPNLIKTRIALQTEADLLSTTEAERLIFKSRCLYYEEGDKPSKLLSVQSVKSFTLIFIRVQTGSATF